MNTPDLESVLLAVWQQTLIDNARNVTVADETFPVRTTPKQKLKQIDFRFDGREIRGLEQNPATESRWAAMARKGSKIMQFLEHGRYVAAVADGKVYSYRRAE